jgi:hypothetical protein
LDRSERFYKIDQMLRSRGTVTTEEFKRELEVSLATLKRDLEYMKSRHNAPIEWDRGRGRLPFRQANPPHQVRARRPVVQPARGAGALSMEHLLENLEPGLLGAQSSP